MEFSINAGQPDFQNEWTERFLNQWQMKENEIREAIIIKDQQEEFLNFKIDCKQIEENPKNNEENNNAHQIFIFDRTVHLL